MMLVAINKTDAALDAAVAVRHPVRFGRAAVFQLTAASATPARAADLTLPVHNALLVRLPAMSVSTLVLTP